MASAEAYAKPLPVPDPDSAPFWDGCREGRLMIQHCEACGQDQFPPGNVCSHCGARAIGWRQASGAGTVFSWIVVRHPVPKPVYADEVPYVVALVELAEGVRMPSNIIGCAPEAVTAGMPVKVVFRPAADGIVLPLFEPA
jgi:uncharacterized OB-fold protein